MFSKSDPRASMLLAVHVGRVRPSLVEERVVWQLTGFPTRPDKAG